MRRYSTEAKRYNIALLHTSAHLVDAFDDVLARGDAASADELRLARAAVHDAMLMLVDPTSARKDAHEQQGGTCWSSSEVLSTDEDIIRVYSAGQVHGELLGKGGELQHLNVATYLRRRARALDAKQERLGARHFAELIEGATTKPKKPAPPQVVPVIVDAGPSAAAVRKQALHSALGKRGRPVSAEKRELEEKREKLRAAIAANEAALARLDEGEQR